MIQLFASDPAIMGGAAVFAGTMVLVQALFDYLALGETIAAFLHDHPDVSNEQVAVALEVRELD
jgi:uncharacterized protein (DUF433 family)